MRILFLLLPMLFLSLYAKIHTNALIKEHSPYLQLHAHNPVNWYPYTKEAFEKAKKEDKLIFMSIGFSTCHWCHVMEKESFENEKIAALLNKDYIAIKVDKEEMPQIDTYYQDLFQKLQHRRNGWPLSIIMTPKKEILFMGLYLPPKDKYGIEGLKTLLPKYAKLYHTNKAKISRIWRENAKKLSSEKKSKSYHIEDQNITDLYVDRMYQRFDKIYKGFDRRPRFPMASYLRFLLDIYLLNGNERAWKMVEESLEAMAMGGIYDQIEGGFFRYTTDQDWVIPHYEKMLYTNAELLELYVRVYLLTKKPLFKKVVVESLAQYEKYLQEDHLFFGATDADSMGEEGGYFTYDYDEVKSALQKEGFKPGEIEVLLEYFDIMEPGNFKENKSNVHFHTGFEKDEIPKRVEEVKEILRKMRLKREFPFVDRKIITSWNAMMIKTLFHASLIDVAYLEHAKRSLSALLERNYQKGVLYHYSIDRHPPRKKALLEDYAFLIDVLLSAYEITYEKSYLAYANHFAQEAIAKFYDGKRWYLNEEEPRVIPRYFDRYYTTPLARMFHNLLSLSSLNYDLKLYYQTKKMLKEERERILGAFDDSPEALRALARLWYGDIVLKATKKRLLKYQKKIATIRYPFLLTKVENSDLYLLCDMQSCFYYDKNLTKVKEKIENRKK